jgi:hypothetical protein
LRKQLYALEYIREVLSYIYYAVWCVLLGKLVDVLDMRVVYTWMGKVSVTLNVYAVLLWFEACICLGLCLGVCCCLGSYWKSQLALQWFTPAWAR